MSRIFSIFIILIISINVFSCQRKVTKEHKQKQVINHVEYLKSLVPDSIRGNINSGFYDYFGFRDWWRFPLKYPFAIHCVDVVDDGFLEDESEVSSFDNPNNGRKSTGIKGIKSFTFDSVWFLCEFKNDSNNMLFSAYNFNNHKSHSFDKKSDLIKYAFASGYNGDTTFISIRKYADKF